MSNFTQRSPKDNPGSILRQKEAGPSLAVDILRGRGSSKPDFIEGCLTSSEKVELRQLHDPDTVFPIYTQELEKSTESGTVAESFISSQDTPIRSSLPPLPPPPLISRPECVPMPDIHKAILPSHSFQRRPSNMGWNGSRNLNEWRFENAVSFENPLSCLPENYSTAVGREVETVSIKEVESKRAGKTTFARVAQSLRPNVSADDESYSPHFPQQSISSCSNLKPFRQRSTWRSFLKESTVPDVPLDPLKASSYKSGRRRPSRLSLLTPNHHRLPLEKSVTWKDSKAKQKKSDKRTSSKIVDMQSPQKDELVAILADLCDTLEHSSILRHTSVYREISPDLYQPCPTQSLSKMTESRGKSLELCTEAKQLSVREEKVVVEVRVVFLKIGEIDTLKEFYQADAFLQTKWREPRLDGKLPEELGNVDLECYWNPLCYIDNILSETKEVQWLSTSIGQGGEVYIVERRRVKGIFLETLELNDFPLDVQDLTITVTTERPDTEVDLIPDHNEMSAINKQTFIDQQEWKLHEHVEITKRVICQEYSRSMKSHPCLSVTCRAARRSEYFYWNVFLIMFMISGLSFATFAVSPDKAELRLRLSFTLILTSVTFKYVIAQSLPRISYLTYMDKYVLMSLAILCLISIWHAVIAILPVHVMAPLDNLAIPNSSEAVQSSVSATSPNLLHEALRGSGAYIPGAAAPQSTPKTLGQRGNLSSLGNVGSEFSLSKDFYFDVPAPPYVQPDPSRKSGVSVGDYTLNDEMVSLYFLALLRAYMEVQDRVEFSHFPDPKQTEEALRLELMKRLEHNVFISFAVLYVIVHLIFIFILWFDASKRRREMRRRDKEYRSKVAKFEDKRNHQLHRVQK